jgi:voltage-gated potassium channel
MSSSSSNFLENPSLTRSARLLEYTIYRDTGTFADYADDLTLFFLLQFMFFLLIPSMIVTWRLLFGWKRGLMAAIEAPIGRHGNTRSPASALRFYLFEQTKVGYYMDITQAVLSTISCIMFIFVAYAAYDPEGVQDIEFFFTIYFFADYMLRLYIARDSLVFFFSLVSMLDFITVIPAIVMWLMSGLQNLESNVQVIVQCIRVMRVFRIFRVIRVIRVISVSQNFAFQRQVFVLVMTVLSLVFAAAGLFQIFESQPGKEYPFHKAVYYAAITVIGRPGVPFTATFTPVFLTILALIAATIIPTFVAELIRLWYDNAALDFFPGNPEAPHTIVCGDTNASRLRVLVNQYFHSSRDPNDLAPICILAEPKPEGALRQLLEQHKHSGNVVYVRGSGRRTADLRRAGANLAKTVIVLNYRSDKDAQSSDTEVLSTVMAVKNVKPNMNVLAQLHRAKKRHQLKLVPGWTEGDKALASLSLGATLVGIGTLMPGFATLVTNLIRRGQSEHAPDTSSIQGKAEAGWRVFLRGEAAKPASTETLDNNTGKIRSRTPQEEYASSIDAQVGSIEVTADLEGRTFASAARVAFLRYGVSLIGATVPVNAALAPLMHGLPLTFRLALFPADTVLCRGMALFAIASDPAQLELFRIETGGRVLTGIEKVTEAVNFLPDIGGNAGHNDSNSAAPAAAIKPSNFIAFKDIKARAAAVESLADTLVTGLAASMVGLSEPPPPDQQSISSAIVNVGGLFGKPGSQHVLNTEAVKDLTISWDWTEQDFEGTASNTFLRSLHIPVFTPTGERLQSAEAKEDGSSQPHVSPTGSFAPVGPRVLLNAAAVTGNGIVSITGDLRTGVSLSSITPAIPSSSSPSSSPNKATTLNTSPSTTSLVSEESFAKSLLALATDAHGRRPSIGDDGCGGIDDTDDVTGVGGPLVTNPLWLGATRGSTASAIAAAATAANVNALAVRLALPAAAGLSEDITLNAKATVNGSGQISGHVLILGVNDNIGFILRAIGSMLTKNTTISVTSDAGSTTTAAAAVQHEGEQYDLRSTDVVILASAKPADAAINACYAGASRLLNKVTFITGNPSDASDLIKAGVTTSRAVLILTQSKPAASADGQDNLSDDTEGILITSTVYNIAPLAHVITEVLHGAHAPFIRPTGNNLNDAQRAAFAYILEEREATRQRVRLDDAIKQLEAKRDIENTGETQLLLRKLYQQQARLRALLKQRFKFNGLKSVGTGSIDSATADALGVSSGGGLDSDIDVAFSNLSNAAIVDALVGVREDFGSAASGAANDGASFSTGSGGSGQGGASKGSGATNDLYTSPAFAGGRVFSFATMDSIVTEARFEPYIVSVVKQLVRAARKQRLVMIPVTEAVIMCRISKNASTVAATHGTGSEEYQQAISPTAVTAIRAQYFTEIASKLPGGGSSNNSSGSTGGGRRSARNVGSGGSGGDTTSSLSSSVTTSSTGGVKFEIYGEVYESLLRNWKLLPIGIYRRSPPASGLKANSQTAAAVSAAAGLPMAAGIGGGENSSLLFGHNRALVSYVFSNPPPETLLCEHDLIYAIREDDDEDVLAVSANRST